jgi:predicted SprT family Zn-dependent metalloprotease
LNLLNFQFFRELTDPTPDIFSLFQTFNIKFFLGKLGCVELEWSKKMYQCAGICYLRKNSQHMACTIRLSEPLLKLRTRKELVETLLHEMIHAWNFIHSIYEENGGHGKNFLAKMYEINRKAGTNITVYHSFHDEVELYKTHWWRCEGPCRNRKPYYGYVKRVSNRAPGKNDSWWAEHERTCSGKFIKIKEPEKTEKKKKKDKGNNGDIRKYFPNLSSQSSSEIEDDDFMTDDRGFVVGTPPKTPKRPSKPAVLKTPKQGGNVLGGNGDGKSKLLDNKPSTSTGGGVTLGGPGNGRSRLLDMFDKKRGVPPENKPTVQPAKKIKIGEPLPGPAPKIKVEPPELPPIRKSIYRAILSEFDDDDDIVLIDDEFDDNLGDSQADKIPAKTDELCNCPICNQAMKVDEINNHLDECLTIIALQENSQEI